MTDVAQADGPTDESSDGTIRRHLVLTGILQGIGCRPTIYRLAHRLGLGGWVSNSTSGVHIEIEGTPEKCRTFEVSLPEAIPFPGRIAATRVEQMPPLGEKTFRISASLEGERTITPIPPDVAVCSECVEELFDPSNPRYLYPFITCTLCGPRFTVVRSFPYDRERTSMADFFMCPRCREEYEAPLDRRFHSQTNSCPKCGPRLTLLDGNGSPIEGDPIPEAIRLLAKGAIVAVKGIGGFHLACDALQEDAVRLLRERKGREEKPFAVMMPNMATVRRFCAVNATEEGLLTSPVAPIALLAAQGEPAAGNVAPFVGTLGVMLPYSPLHHLLFGHPIIPPDERPTVLVMTSGNRSEEPIVRGNDEALDRLRGLADAFLVHDREIVLRADDSIIRVIAGRPVVFRRSRGLAPSEFSLGANEPAGSEPLDGPADQAAGKGGQEPVVLGAGSDLKNALAIVKGSRVIPGPHVGDLASPVAQDYFRTSVSVLTGYMEAEPEVIGVDPHPEYFSNNLGRQLGRPVYEVFHHHAHAASLLLEHGLSGPALFAVFDGTGYGTDATIWGGEFLLAGRASFERVGHIGRFQLPGGEAAIREPVRILAALLASSGVSTKEMAPLMGDHRDRVKYWLEAAAKGINSPETSSAGRLFDAAAAAVGFRRSVTFEGEAAMWLEAVSDPAERGEYEIRIFGENPLMMDTARIIHQLARDVLSGAQASRTAAKFHNTMARGIAEMLVRLSGNTGIKTVGLTGGCFQNKLLAETAASMLEKKGFEVLLHKDVPPNDGGIALGQAVSVRARLEKDQGPVAK